MEQGFWITLKLAGVSLETLRVHDSRIPHLLRKGFLTAFNKSSDQFDMVMAS